MSMTPRSTSEGSISFSLAELARIEEERMREEEAQRARAREREARAREKAEVDRRAAEAARALAEGEAKARREREEASARIRADARERAAADVARIEAEARARLDADNAQRAHELAVLRTRAEGGRRRLVGALGAALLVAIAGGVVASYQASDRIARLSQEAGELREAGQALAREREQGKAIELAALDRRFAALRARSAAGDTDEARKVAEAARRAVDERALDHDRLRAYGDALDGLEARLDGLSRLAALDRRRANLAAWAGSVRQADLTADAQHAAAVAKAAGTDEALRAYEGALDRLHEALAQPRGAGAVRVATGEKTTGPARACLKGDPGCDLERDADFLRARRRPWQPGLPDAQGRAEHERAPRPGAAGWGPAAARADLRVPAAGRAPAARLRRRRWPRMARRERPRRHGGLGPAPPRGPRRRRASGRRRRLAQRDVGERGEARPARSRAARRRRRPSHRAHPLRPSRGPRGASHACRARRRPRRPLRPARRRPRRRGPPPEPSRKRARRGRDRRGEGAARAGRRGGAGARVAVRGRERGRPRARRLRVADVRSRGRRLLGREERRARHRRGARRGRALPRRDWRARPGSPGQAPAAPGEPGGAPGRRPAGHARGRPGRRRDQPRPRGDGRGRRVPA